MQRTLLTMLSLIMLPAVALAQWDFQSNYPVEEFQFGNAHGIAVDPDGKVWVQYLGNTDSVQVADFDNEYRPVRVLYVFNPDGSQADFSPVKFVDLPGGERDTLGGRIIINDAGEKEWFGHAGTGLRADHNGNIIVAVDGSPGVELESGILLYRLDYTTGEGMTKAEFEARGPTAPAVDADGNVYVTDIFPGGPILVLDEDFNFVENAVDVSVGFSRSFEVSPDGSTIYWAGYTTNSIVAYQRPDPFSPYDSLGVVIPGVDSESMSWHPTTGHLWVAAGSPNDQPNDYEGFETNWQIQTWYAFDPADLQVNSVPTPLDSITWEGGGDGRPRGIAFSPAGDVSYVIQFSQPAPSAQVFIPGEGTSIERNEGEVPVSMTLSQNYPNPFNPSTRIEFALHHGGHANLKVFDVLGREVAVLVDEQLGAGSYTATFDAGHLPSGAYMYQLSLGAESRSGTMLLVK